MKRAFYNIGSQSRQYGIDDSIAEYLELSERDFESNDGQAPSPWLNRFVQALNDFVAGVRRQNAPGTVDTLTKNTTNPCNRFSQVLARIRNHPNFSEASTAISSIGYFGGRPIIAEGTSFNGGVYLGAAGHEALVVDARHGELPRVFNELHSLLLAMSTRRPLSEDAILQEVVNLVCHKILFDEIGTQRILKGEKITVDFKTSIDLFIKAGVGVARHQVVLAGYLIESLKEKGFLRGFITLDETSAHQEYADERLIYTGEAGRTFIFDPLELHQTARQAA